MAPTLAANDSWNAAAVRPGEKAELLYEIVQRQGHNATQNNVSIEKAAVTK